jgi:hypothetical protein
MHIIKNFSRINEELCCRQFLLVKETINRVFWGPRYFLEENKITNLDDITFLRTYLRYFLNKTKKHAEKQRQKDSSILCGESLDHYLEKFKRADKELTKIIREKKLQSC